MVARPTRAGKRHDFDHRETASQLFRQSEAQPDCTNDYVPIALSADYQAQALATARVQLEKAGVRLAWVLNRAAAKAGGTS